MSSQSESRESIPDDVRVFRELFSAVIVHGQATAGAVGMHPVDLYALNIADLHGPVTAGELAQRTGLSSGAVTRLIDRLETAGQIRRAADPADRRRVLVEKVHGHEVDDGLEKTLEPLARRIDALLGQYSDLQLDLVREFIARTTAVLVEATREINEVERDGKGTGS